MNEGRAGDITLDLAAAAAWARYASTCRMGGTDLERHWSYRRAIAAERRLWQAQGAPAAKAAP
jgi:hypothetical protein